jgi:nanoRNase/pAp phosphatase (c-di-AMP/oligoRNAs hydrolase)
MSEAEKRQSEEQEEQQMAAKTHDERPLEFFGVLEQHRGERHVIVLQDFPDPDAISSAYAHQLLAQVYDIQSDIIYAGRISHRQNIALVKLLGIDLLRYDQATDLSQYGGAVLVDNQGTTAVAILEALRAVNVPLVAIVDHHEPQDEIQAEFSDIRRAGAAATIYAEYLEHGPVKLDRSRREHLIAATALMHGILSDTGGFVRAKAEDFHAAGFLSQFHDADLLAQVMSQARSKQVMAVILQALENRVVVENVSIAGIGYLRSDDRDAIPQATDFLLTEENVHTAMVYGIVTSGDPAGEKLVGSMRTSKITMDPDGFIKEAFGTDLQGRYFGGGKLSAGGFEVAIGFLSGAGSSEYRELKWQVYDMQIKQKIFAKIGVEAPPHG